MLRTNIRFLGAGSRARSFAVTSATPGEGKTTTAANLAVSLADSGLRTVVVDADMRRPNLARVLGLEGAVGLSDVLIGRVELDDVLQHWGRDGLVVLPAGDVPPNPSELLGSGAMRALLDDLGQRFDVVVVDTPPLLSVTDAALVGEMVTSTLLVVAAGRTRRDHVATALERLAVAGTPRAAVLTMTRRTRRDDYSYYAEGVEPLRGARALLRPFRGGRAPSGRS
nr:CpsD/CapB family tyrosine-protein kinase [Frigoribacterium sp. VKM Ac-2530]